MGKRKDSPKQGFNKFLLDGAVCEAIVDNLYEGVYVIDDTKTIIYWNKAAEKLTGFTAKEVLGKRCTKDIICHLNQKGKQLCMSGLCPADEVFTKGRLVENEFFVRHKDGYRISVLSRLVPLKDAKGGITRTIALLTENTREVIDSKKSGEMRWKAYFDPLTEIGNRRLGEASLSSKLGELKRYGWPFGLIYADVDGFRALNEKYGRIVGDKALKMVANTLQKSARPFDIFARWDGEEFIGIIVNVNEADLFITADRFRALVEQSGFSEGKQTVKATISIGATIAQPDDTIDIIIDRAYKLMSHSKEAGRNRVSMK